MSDINLFNLKELQRATARKKSKKAPGPDEIPPEAIKQLVSSHPSVFLDTYNECLRRGVFPEAKGAKLVLLEKPKKHQRDATTYRPLCLLNILGKLPEQLLLQRLNKEIEETGGLANNQHGFRPGHSTIDAMITVKDIVNKKRKLAYQNRGICTLTCIDIKNAFNSASWSEIIKTLNGKNISLYLLNMLQSYLHNRHLIVGSSSKIQASAGVPQGSILGPTLWNVLFDKIVRIRLLDDVYMVAYTDDIAIVTTAGTLEDLTEKFTYTITYVEEQLTEIGLSVAKQKTELVILYGPRSLKQIEINVSNSTISSNTHAKYLGVYFDHHMSFRKHVQEIQKKAGATSTAICKLLPNTYGPFIRRRTFV